MPDERDAAGKRIGADGRECRDPSMASALEQLQEKTGAKFATLLDARDYTAKRLAERRSQLSRLAVDANVAVVMMGSWGRRELTSESDDDFMLLVHGAPGSGEPRPTVDEVRRVLAGDPAGFGAPGREGIFADVVYSADLVERVGLDDDTNTNLTRRMLLILESVAACNEAVLADARRAVIDDYLRDSIKDHRPPRFLLNDLVRYWRTIGVDFVAKDRRRGGEGWGLRNAKLRTSRKLLFASGLLPVLRCHALTAAEIPAFLAAQFALPPTDRVADAFLQCGAEDAGAAVLAAYDRFLALLANPDARKALRQIDSRAAADDEPIFGTVAEIGQAINDGLLELLFGAELRKVTQTYAIL